MDMRSRIEGELLVASKGLSAEHCNMQAAAFGRFRRVDLPPRYVRAC